ncbi:MAG: hypothetical protein LQ340_008111, partial [Diploschistes diacapsis]
MGKKQHTRSPASELHMRRPLRRAEGVKHGLAVRAQAVGEEDAQGQTRQRADGGVGRDLAGGFLEERAVFVAEAFGVSSPKDLRKAARESEDM